MGQVDLIFRLQQTDDELRAAKKRLSKVVHLQKESQELQRVREHAKKTMVELQKGQATQKELNLELNSLNSKVKSSEQRLYSGRVKNPKELADLQQGIEALGRRRAALEDELLEAMILVEKVEAEALKATEALQQFEAEWEASQLTLQQEQAELVQRINDLMARRKNQIEIISPESMAAYEGAIRRVGPLAAVVLRINRCGGCQVTVPTNLVKAADEGQLVNCDSCGRILCPA